MSGLSASALGLVLGLASSPDAAGAGPTARRIVVEPSMVARAWRAYARRFIRRSGRVIDRSDGNRTTSEGQAYALVRAAWADDEATFNRVLRWTRTHLQGGDSTALPAWWWGLRDGAWGVVDPNPAADADVWMAYAMLVAAERWNRPELLHEARGMIASIWRGEVAAVGPWTVLLPGPWAQSQDPVRINPSYLLPFAFRAFAEVDPDHDWMALVDGSYDVLGILMSGDTLPPDWAHFERSTGQRAPEPDDAPENSAAHGWEALRVAWTLAADARWHGEPRARALMTAYADLAERYGQDGRLGAIVDGTGAALVPYGSPALYGSLLAAWSEVHPTAATHVFEQEIEALAGPRGLGGWGAPDDYYGHNWTWLGVAFWTGVALPPGGSR